MLSTPGCSLQVKVLAPKYTKCAYTFLSGARFCWVPAVTGVRFQSMNRSTGSHRSPEKVVGDEGWRTAPHDKMTRYHRQHAGQLPGWQTGFLACGHPENPVSNLIPKVCDYATHVVTR